MSLTEKGIYIELLADQWCNGPFTLDVAARICAEVDRAIVQSVVEAKFAKNKSGLWYNARLEQERESQEARRKAQQENGSKGGRPKANANPNETHGLSLGSVNANPKQNPNETQTQSQSKPKNNPSVSVSVSGFDSVSVSENTLSHSKGRHFENEEFRTAWASWKAKQAEVNCRPMDGITEEAQLYSLESFESSEAIAIVRFSTSRTNCRNLITNGDHKPKKSSDKQESKKKSLKDLIIQPGE